MNIIVSSLSIILNSSISECQRKRCTSQAKFEDPIPNIDSSEDFPVKLTNATRLSFLMIIICNIIQTLEEAKKIPMRRGTLIPYQQLSAVHVENSNTPNYELDIEVLKEELTRKNYKKKFHHLLHWEEKEHQRIIIQK